jgi:hypothetical protein
LDTLIEERWRSIPKKDAVVHRADFEPSTPAITFMEIPLIYLWSDCDLEDTIEPLAK